MMEQPDHDRAEELAAAHMRRLGFHGAKRTPTGPDQGIDVIAPMAIAQVKKQTGNVSRSAVQQLLGSGSSSCARLFYSASAYSRNAREFAEEKDIALFVYDLSTGKVDATSKKAIELEHAAGFPGIPDPPPAREEGCSEASVMAGPIPQPLPPSVATASYFSPPPQPVRATMTSAVEVNSPQPYRWYFLLAGLTVGVFAWVAFIHAYLRTSNPLWRTWAIVFGVWCPVFYGLYSMFSSMARSGGGSAAASGGKTVFSVVALGVAALALALLTQARREALGMEKPPPTTGSGLPVNQLSAVLQSAPPPARAAATPLPPSIATPTPKWSPPTVGRQVGSIVWAISPLLMVSFGGPITFLISACIRRTMEMWLYFALHLGLFIVLLVGSGNFSTNVFGLFAATAWIGGTAHAFLIRRRAWYLPSPSAVGSEPVVGS